MILQCPECTARFAVPDALIPPEGRTVKCGRCAHQWHAPGPEPVEGDVSFAELANAAQAEAAPLNPSLLPVKQPDPIKPKGFIIGTAALAACWMVLAFLAYYPGWMNTPGLRGIYGAMGMTSTEGLVFEDVSMQRNSVGSQTQFLITGSITNHAADSRIVPTVRVQLKNADGDAIWVRKYPVNEPLEAGKPYAFRIDNVETAFAGSVTTIALDLGHPLQLMMR